MTFHDRLAATERKLQVLGLIHWANKLSEIAHSGDSEQIMAQKVLGLYGGFGTLNDIAFSDGEAANGMSGEEATQFYFASINALHNAAEAIASVERRDA